MRRVARGGIELDRAAGEGRLVRRAKRGDATAFAELVKRHDARLRGLAFHLLGDRELMDDVMQEACAKR